MRAPLKLPTKWVRKGRTADELEELENCGVDIDSGDEYYESGFIYVFPDHIVAFNKSGKGFTTLRLSDGEVYRIDIPFKEWLMLIDDLVDGRI